MPLNYASAKKVYRLGKVSHRWEEFGFDSLGDSTANSFRGIGFKSRNFTWKVAGCTPEEVVWTYQRMLVFALFTNIFVLLIKAYDISVSVTSEQRSETLL